MRPSAKDQGKIESRDFDRSPGDPVASRIVKFRNRHGWRQRELARRAGLLPSRLSRLERGLTEPRLSELVSLARFLAVEDRRLALALIDHLPKGKGARAKGQLYSPEGNLVAGKPSF